MEGGYDAVLFLKWKEDVAKGATLVWVVFFFFPFFFGRRESYYGCYRQDQQELLLRN